MCDPFEKFVDGEHICKYHEVVSLLHVLEVPVLLGEAVLLEKTELTLLGFGKKGIIFIDQIVKVKWLGLKFREGFGG